MSTGNDTIQTIIAENGSAAIPDTTQLLDNVNHIAPGNFNQQLYSLPLYEQATKRFHVRNVEIPVNTTTMDTTILAIPYGHPDFMSVPMRLYAQQHSLMNEPIEYEFTFITASTIVNALLFGIGDGFRASYTTGELNTLQWEVTSSNSDTRECTIRMATPLTPGGSTTAVGNLITGVNPRSTPVIGDMVPTLVIQTLTGVQNSYQNDAVSVTVVIWAKFKSAKGFRWTQTDYRNAASTLTGLENSSLTSAAGTKLSDLLRLEPGWPIYATLDGTIYSKFPVPGILTSYAGDQVFSPRQEIISFTDDSPTYTSASYANLNFVSNDTNHITMPVVGKVSYRFKKNTTTTYSAIDMFPYEAHSFISYMALAAIGDFAALEASLKWNLSAAGSRNLQEILDDLSTNTMRSNFAIMNYPFVELSAPSSACGFAHLHLINGPPLITSLETYKTGLPNEVATVLNIYDNVVSQIVGQGLQLLSYTVVNEGDLEISLRQAFPISEGQGIPSGREFKGTAPTGAFDTDIARGTLSNYSYSNYVPLSTFENSSALVVPHISSAMARLITVSDGDQTSIYLLIIQRSLRVYCDSTIDENTVRTPMLTYTRPRTQRNGNAMIIPMKMPMNVEIDLQFSPPRRGIVTLLDEQRLSGVLTVPTGFSILEFSNVLQPTLNEIIAESSGRTVVREPYFDRSWKNLLRSMNYDSSSQYIRFTLSNVQNIIPMAAVLYDGQNDLFMLGNSPSNASQSYLSLPIAAAEDIIILNLQVVPKGNAPASSTNSFSWPSRTTATDTLYFDGNKLSIYPTMNKGIISASRTAVKVITKSTENFNRQGAALATAIGGGASGLGQVLQQNAMQDKYFSFMSQYQQQQLNGILEQMAQQFSNNKELQKLASQYSQEYLAAQNAVQKEQMEYNARLQGGYTSLAQHQRNNELWDKGIDFQPASSQDATSIDSISNTNRAGFGLTNVVPQTSQTLAESTPGTTAPSDTRMLTDSQISAMDWTKANPVNSTRDVSVEEQNSHNLGNLQTIKKMTGSPNKAIQPYNGGTEEISTVPEVDGLKRFEQLRKTQGKGSKGIKLSSATLSSSNV